MSTLTGCLLLGGLTLSIFYVLFRVVIGPLPIHHHTELWVLTCPEAREPALVCLTQAGPLRMLLGLPRFRVTECTSCQRGSPCGRRCVRGLRRLPQLPPSEAIPSLTHSRIRRV